MGHYGHRLLEALVVVISVRAASRGALQRGVTAGSQAVCVWMGTAVPTSGRDSPLCGNVVI